MTTDGLFVGALFRDARIPAEPLPEKETKGLRLEGLSACGRQHAQAGHTNGGEPFNGGVGHDL